MSKFGVVFKGLYILAFFSLLLLFPFAACRKNEVVEKEYAWWLDDDDEGSGKDDPSKPDEPIPGGDEEDEGGGTEPVYAKDGQNFMGTVTCDGKGVAGCVVTDGVNFYRTDHSGRYWLPGKVSSTDFVYISIPSGYEVASDATYGIVPQFYKKVNKSGAAPQTFNFTLKKVDQSNYTLLLMTDQHIQNRNIAEITSGKSKVTTNDREAYVSYCVNYLKGYASGLKTKGPVYGLCTGDMTMYEYWAGKYNANYAYYLDASKSLGFPVFHVIGNHDHADGKTMTDYMAAEQYRNYFGPTYYSFNIGDRHIIGLDNMEVTENNASLYDPSSAPGGYKIRLGAAQLAWLKSDVAAMGKKVKEVILMCHVPMAHWSAPSTNTANVTATISHDQTEFNQISALLSKYKVRIFSGHDHVSQNFNITPNMVQHTHPSICGMYWYTWMCADGTPSGATEYSVSGDSFKRKLVPFPTAYRNNPGYIVYSDKVRTGTGITVYNKNQDSSGAVEGGDPCILVNFFQWHPSWKIQVYEGDQPGTGAMVWRCDLDARKAMENGEVNLSASNWLGVSTNLHMFQYTPARTSSKITLLVSDEDGKMIYNITDIQLTL